VEEVWLRASALAFGSSASERESGFEKAYCVSESRNRATAGCCSRNIHRIPLEIAIVGLADFDGFAVASAANRSSKRASSLS
jgi:hypothetical protein